MQLFKKKKYSLNDIQRLFYQIPIVFILFLGVLLFFITYLILDSKKAREIDLLKQKYTLNYNFEIKENLNMFKIYFKKQLENSFLKEERVLKDLNYRVKGYIESNKLLAFSDLEVYLRGIEKSNNVSFCLFKKDDLNIVYGDSSIKYLQKMIYNSQSKKYKELTLKYIYSQGSKITLYWNDDVANTIRLSFFDFIKIDNQIYFIGTFSTINSTNKIARRVLIDSIKETNFNIYSLDLINKQIFNFKNEKKYTKLKDIIKNQKNTIYKKLLEYYGNNYDFNKKFKDFTFLYDKYNFLIVSFYDKKIIDDRIKDKIDVIQKDYRNLLIQIFIYIFLISTLLIVFNYIFSNFIKSIFTEYNEELESQKVSLEHWKKRFELAIIASNDGLWDIDFKTNKIYFSDKWLEMFGYEKKELKAFSDWFELIHNEEKTKVENLFEQIFSKVSDTIICEYRLKTKNEGFKWVLVRGKSFLDEDGNLDRMLMMSMDIDKSKRMKKELLDVELLVDDGKIVIFKLINDSNLSVKYISKSIKNFGFIKKDFEDGSINFMDIIYPEDMDKVQVSINAALKNELENFTFICRVSNGADEIRWIESRVILIKNHSGHISHLYGYINDITKIKMSEEELKVKVSEELDKNRQKDRILIQQSKLAAMGEMLGNIAHQWRQPLNNISLILQFLRDNYKNEAVSEQMIDKYMKKAHKHMEYMSDTIDDFKNFYKPSKTKNSFCLKDSINSLLYMIKNQFERENIKIEFEAEDVQITNYENELKQSLLNIFNNAKDAILSRKEKEEFDGVINIAIKKDEKKVYISIKNNGGNIKEDIIDRIFEPYFTTKFETQGTGIGLYMTKSIIETNMGGKIEVKNLDKSVEFVISLDIK